MRAPILTLRKTMDIMKAKRGGRMDKQEVFSIMGSYYGNAYFRDATLTPEDARLIAQILDEINALGYHVSSLHALERVCDTRFVKVITQFYQSNANLMRDQTKEGLLCGLANRKYKEAVPFLLREYRVSDREQIKYRAADVLRQIGDRGHEADYVALINEEAYCQCDGLYVLLCKLKSQAAYPRIVELVHLYPAQFKFTFLQAAWRYRRAELLPEFESFLSDPESEIRTMAKHAIQKLERHGAGETVEGKTAQKSAQEKQA